MRGVAHHRGVDSERTEGGRGVHEGHSPQGTPEAYRKLRRAVQVGGHPKLPHRRTEASGLRSVAQQRKGGRDDVQPAGGDARLPDARRRAQLIRLPPRRPQLLVQPLLEPRRHPQRDQAEESHRELGLASEVEPSGDRGAPEWGESIDVERDREIDQARTGQSDRPHRGDSAWPCRRPPDGHVSRHIAARLEHVDRVQRARTEGRSAGDPRQQPGRPTRVGVS